MCSGLYELYRTLDELKILWSVNKTDQSANNLERIELSGSS